MKQLAVVSGKGGTGKTSVAASFASLAKTAVAVDCDVDASNLHMLLGPKVLQKNTFAGGLTAFNDAEHCVECGTCLDFCRFDAIDGDFQIDPLVCEGCGVCHDLCPAQSITLIRETAGEWFVSKTRYGPMVHAQLGVAQENSGRLVAQVRQKAIALAEENRIDLLLIDGSPGIGCPVISAITGVDLVLAVTEPTPSGAHDVKRVMDLAAHFGVPVALCVNKFDLNVAVSDQIEALARQSGATCAGRIPYDELAIGAVVNRQPLVENGNDGKAARAVRALWSRLGSLLQEKETTHHAHL